MSSNSFSSGGIVSGQVLGQVIAQLRPNDAQVIARVAAVQLSPNGSAVQESQSVRDAVAQAQEQIQNFVRSMERNFSFVKDATSGYIVVSVIDPQTGAVIRRLPGDELLRLARTFEQAGNMLVNQKA